MLVWNLSDYMLTTPTSTMKRNNIDTLQSLVSKLYLIVAFRLGARLNVEAEELQGHILLA